MQTLLKLKQSTLSLNDALVLGFVCLNPDCRQKEIMAAVNLNPTVISQTVKKFVHRKLVTEAPLKLSESARNWAKVYRATEEGVDLAGPFIYPDVFQDVVDFSEKFGFPLGKHKASKMTEDQVDAMFKHLSEELEEYSEALDSKDREKQFDALLDLAYLAIRYCAVNGFNFHEGWRRVQAANMAKIRVKTPGESKRGTSFDVKKPEGWKAPVLTDLI